MTRWQDLAGAATVDGYQRRFDELAAAGRAVHGEADFVADLVHSVDRSDPADPAGPAGPADPGARILDAGCGTGRVAVELAGRGFDVVGVDSDPSMLAVARQAQPGLVWLERDLSGLDSDDPELNGRFAVVVLAGNVIPLLGPDTERQTVARLAACLAPQGFLVAGFGLDVAHLPLDFVPVTLAEYDGWCLDAGLAPEAVFATWERDAYREDSGYAVSVHRRTAKG